MQRQTYNTIKYEKDSAEPHLGYVILNRPAKANAISIGPDEMTGELQDAVRRADADEQVKVVVFKAEGRDFSAGFDLSMVYRVYGGKPGVRPHQSERLRIDEEQIVGFSRAIFNCKKATIAQVHGWCIEAGIRIPESCDIAVAATDAKFAHRGQRLAFGGIPSALELVSGHAKKHVELLMTGRTIGAREAEEIGIITKAVPPEDLQSEVYNLAKALCLLPLDAIALGKMARKHIYDSLGLNTGMNNVVYHTLGTNVTYRADEKESMFIRDREAVGEKEAFHKLHTMMEDALKKTKYFRSLAD